MRLDRPFAQDERGRDLAVRSSFRDEDGHAALCRSETFFPGAAADPSELGARLHRKARGAALLEDGERLLDRLPGRALLTGAPGDDAEREERTSMTETVSERVVGSDGFGQELEGLVDVAFGRCDEPAAAFGLREHPRPVEARRRLFPRVEEQPGVVEPAELDEPLHVVGTPPAKPRLLPSGAIGRSVGEVEVVDRGSRVAGPELGKARHCEQPWQQRLLPLGQRATLPCELAGTGEIAAVRRDERDREVAVRILVLAAPVQRTELLGTFCVISGEIETTGTELDDGQEPGSLRADPLVALAEAPVELLEEVAGRCELGRPDEDVREAETGVHQPLLVAGGGGEGVRLLGQPARVRRSADEAEQCEDRQRAGAKSFVAERLGQLQRSASVHLGSRTPLEEADLDGELQVQELLQLWPRGRLCERLSAKRDARPQVAELGLGQEDERIHAPTAVVVQGVEGPPERPGAIDLARREMRAPGGNRAAVLVRGSVHARQPQRVLGELGRHRARTAGVRERGCLVQCGRDGRVRLLRREREMTGSLERIDNDVGKGAVRAHGAPPRRAPGTAPTRAEDA